MNILVIGTGSIGLRHALILHELGENVSLYSENTDRAREISNKYPFACFSNLEQAFIFQPSAVIIANRTDKHISSAKTFAKQGFHLFIEKPLSHSDKDIAELRTIIETNNIIVQMGCVLRFHPVIEKVTSLIQAQPFGTLISGRFWCGSDLRQWRKDQDYRQNYTAKTEYGGGVTLDLIHEIDLSLVFFGYPNSVIAQLDHISDLETQTEDTSQISLRYNNKSMVQIHLDYHRSTPIRGFDIISQNGCILADLLTGEIQWTLRGSDTIELPPFTFDKNEMYKKQTNTFLDCIKNNNTNTPCTFIEGAQALEIAICAKQSSMLHCAQKLSLLQ